MVSPDIACGFAVLEGGDHGEADEAGAFLAELGAGDDEDVFFGELSRVGLAGFARGDSYPEVESALAADCEAELAQVGEEDRALGGEDLAPGGDVSVVGPGGDGGLLDETLRSDAEIGPA